jgi:hypothetical protein
VTIFVEPSGTDHVLMVRDGLMSPSPAGPRLFRASPHPDISFRHPDRLTAERDAEILRNYLDRIAGNKAPSKKDLQKQLS